MIRFIALACLIAGLCWSVPAVAEDPIPGSPGWDELDNEGKWVTYQRALAEDKNVRSPWIHWIAKAKDFAFLEQIVIYDKWAEAGGLLEQNNAPQWIRATFWALNERSSHAFDMAAARILERQPGQVLAWIAKYPDAAKSQGAAAILGNLRKKHPNAKADEVLDALPPLDERKVFAAMAPSQTLAEFGARKRAEPGVTYVHQVERAIRARVRRADASEGVRDELLGLMQHARESVRQTAILAFASLDVQLRPLRPLYYLANNPNESQRLRESALVVLSGDWSPGVRAWIADIVSQRSHPLWQGAVSALYSREAFLVLDADLGWLAQSKDTDEDRVRATRLLEKRWQRFEHADVSADAISLIGQAAWMLASKHPRAKAYSDWVVAWVVKVSARVQVASALYRVRVQATSLPIRELTFAPGAARPPTRAAVDKHAMLLLNRIHEASK